MMSLPGFCPVAVVTLQVGGVSLSSSLCCDSPDSFSPGSVEVFLVQVYRCKSCLFTCGEEGHMTTHLSTHLSNQTAPHSHIMSTSQDFIQTGDKEEEDELFLYDMFDISAQGEGLQVAHTCQVSSLFEDDSLFKEETDQSAHLRTLGLCRISATENSTRTIARSTFKNSTRTTARSTAKNSTRITSKNSTRTTFNNSIKNPTRTTPKNPTRTTFKNPTRTTSKNSTRTTSKNSTRTTVEIAGRTSRTAAKSSGVHRRTSKTCSDLPRPGPSPPHRSPHRTTTRLRQTLEEDPQKQTGFYCSVCDRRCSSALTLRRHRGVHSDLRPFTCRLCPYSSRLKASLLQHQRTHTGERPFRCGLCPYASIDRSSLLRHKRTHSNERPHSCPHCNYSSIQKKSLDLHLQRHHT